MTAFNEADPELFADSMAKLDVLWERAAKMRLWVSDKKNNLAEKIDKVTKADFLSKKKENAKKAKELADKAKEESEKKAEESAPTEEKKEGDKEEKETIIDTTVSKAETKEEDKKDDDKKSEKDKEEEKSEEVEITEADEEKIKIAADKVFDT